MVGRLAQVLQNVCCAACKHLPGRYMLPCTAPPCSAQPALPRPTAPPQDLAGSIHADRQQLRVEELEALFKEPEFPEPRVPESDSEDDEADAAAAAAAIAAATAARQPRRAGAAGASSAAARRSRGRRAATPAASSEGAGGSEATGGSEGLALGRSTRRRAASRRPLNYAELDSGFGSEDDEGEQEERRPAGRRGNRQRRHSGDSDEEEWSPAEDAGEPSPVRCEPARMPMLCSACADLPVCLSASLAGKHE